MLQIQSPFKQFFDTDGSPLDNGNIYIGAVGANPETNPITVYYDDAGTLPVSQPIKTINGYMSRAGSPAIIYSNEENYSITIKNKKGELVANELNALSFSNLQNDLAAPNGSDLVGFSQSGADAVNRTVLAKLRESVSVNDYYRSTDNGSIHLAVQRALAAGHQKIEFTDVEGYNTDEPIVINRNSVNLVGSGKWMTPINARGTCPIIFDVGSASDARFIINIENFVATRTAQYAGSLLCRVRNASYFSMNGIRHFADNKFGSSLEIYGGIYHDYKDLVLQNTIDEMCRVSGGDGSGGAVDGWVVGHRWERVILDTANAGKASPSTLASFIMNDNCSACWFEDVEGYRHQGYLFDLRGTLAKRGRNTLNLFRNLNVEATIGYDAGAIRIGAYANTAIEVGWCQGEDIPAIVMGENSTANRVTNVQVGATNIDAIQDGGTGNRIENCELVGYGGAIAGVRYLSTATKGIFKGGEVQQFEHISVNESGTNARNIVSDVDSFTISGAPIVGFGAGINVVKNIRSSDFDRFRTRDNATSSVNVGWGSDDFEILRIIGTAGNIDEFSNGFYQGQRIIVQPDAGMVIRDIDLAFKNIVLASPSTTLTANGREVFKFWWDASQNYWYQE